MKDKRYLFLWPVLVIGVALIVIPFAMSMPSKVDAAQTMLDDFRPIMKAANVAKTADYYYETFVKLRPVADEGQALATEAPNLIATLAQRLNISPAEVQQLLGLLNNLPQLAPVFAKLVPALDHYKPLIDAMEGNVTNFQKLDSPPSFRLLTWFFVIPGILLVILAAVPLAMGLFRRGASRTA